MGESGRKPWAWVALIGLVLVATPVARAAAISYGDFTNVPPGVSFLDVTESSGTDPVPLFGPPATFVTGLDFDPTSFTANATSGGGDITDGQLNFTAAGNVSPSQTVAIDQIGIAESGDYTLAGIGTAATQVIAGLSINITVTEIDGVAVTPFALPQLSASVGFNLLANPGILQPWSLGINYDIEAALVTAGKTFTYGATEIEVVLNDNLLALSEAQSIAFIAKKNFEIDLLAQSVVVPEPGMASIAFVTVLGVLARRRRG